MSTRLSERFRKERRIGRRVADWMKENYELLFVELGATRCDWRVVGAVVRDLKLVDQRGNPPSRATLARTWKIVSEKEASIVVNPRRVDVSRDQLRIGEIAQGVRSLSGFNEKPSRPPFTLPGGPLVVPNRVEGETTPDVDNQIARVLAEIGGARVPMPKASR